MSQQTIFQLAEAFGPKLPGIPWDVLERKYGVSAEQIVYDYQPTTDGATLPASRDYQLVLGGAWEAAAKVIETIDLSWAVSTTESSEAWNRIKNETSSIGGLVYESFKADVNSILPESMALTVNVEDLRAMVSSLYLTALYSSVVQMKNVMQKMTFAPEDIIRNADETTKAFQLILFLDQEGVLAPLKKNAKPTGAVQIPIVVGAVITIVGVAAVAAIAWSMVTAKKISANNAALSELCGRAAKTGDEAFIRACVELSSINKTALDAGPAFGMNDITKLLLIGGGLYLLVMFGPAIARSLTASQQRSLPR